MRVNIFDIQMKLNADASKNLETFLPFLSSSGLPVDFELDIQNCNHIDAPKEKPVVVENIAWATVKENDAKRYYSFVADENPDRLDSLLEIDENWKKATLKISDTIFLDHQIVPLMDLLFRNLILYHDGILVKSSSIKWKEHGIVFTACPDGGKSTQANLWKKHKNALIVNDEMSAIKHQNDNVWMYGTPWRSIESNPEENKARLKAVVILEKAEKNHIRKLERPEIIKRFYPRCFLPYFDQLHMEKALENLHNIITNVPFYVMQCKPEKEAVDMLAQWLV